MANLIMTFFHPLRNPFINFKIMQVSFPFTHPFGCFGQSLRQSDQFRKKNLTSSYSTMTNIWTKEEFSKICKDSWWPRMGFQSPFPYHFVFGNVNLSLHAEKEEKNIELIYAYIYFIYSSFFSIFNSLGMVASINSYHAWGDKIVYAVKWV